MSWWTTQMLMIVVIAEIIAITSAIVALLFALSAAAACRSAAAAAREAACEATTAASLAARAISICSAWEASLRRSDSSAFSFSHLVAIGKRCVGQLPLVIRRRTCSGPSCSIIAIISGSSNEIGRVFAPLGWSAPQKDNKGGSENHLSSAFANGNQAGSDCSAASPRATSACSEGLRAGASKRRLKSD